MNETDDTELEVLLAYLDEARGFDFGGYKRASLSRRIHKRMSEVGVADIYTYRDFLEAQPDEFVQLFNTVLINVTGFRRDPEAWDYLATSVVPRILASKQDDEPVRIWSAGCSSGEEAYSLALVFSEAMGEDRFRRTVKIYGTDADNDALARARHARYPLKALEDGLTPAQIATYFEANDDGMMFRTDLRRCVIFGRHDLMQDPPISRVDLLSCRNTLMYFNGDAQRRILASFHTALNDGGFLFLGKSEALVTRTNLFETDNLKQRVFEKHGASSRRAADGSAKLGRFGLNHVDIGVVASSFEVSPLAQLVVDVGGMLVLANRHARMILGIAAGQVGRLFRDLEVSYRPLELRSLIDQVLTDRRPITITDVQVDLPNGATDYLEISVAPLNGEPPSGVLIACAQVGRYRLLREELERSRRDLEVAYEELQSTVEELETTNEELQSTNEELETTNEELHSTNEELETMNEELHSTNEELETINDEFRDRTDELDDLTSFMQSIVASLTYGVVVLNEQMAVRVWNHEAEDQWGLRADEVQGQHFLNLDIGLPVGDLAPAIRACINGQVTEPQEVVVSAVNRRGRAIEFVVSVTPLVDGGRGIGAILFIEDASPADRNGQN